MAKRGKKKRRRTRRPDARMRRAVAAPAAGGLRLECLVTEGFLHPDTGPGPSRRARPSVAERAHVARLPESSGRWMVCGG